jgi:hypothetical protein
MATDDVARMLFTPKKSDGGSFEYEQFKDRLTSLEWDALRYLSERLGEDVIISALQNMDTQALREFSQKALIEQAQSSKSGTSRSSTNGLKLNISAYSGNEKESLRRWFVEIKTGITARKITDEPTKVAFALSHLAGAARAWGFNRLLADPDCFPSYEVFQKELIAEYEPPRTLHRAIAEFLELEQNKLSLHDYIQQMRYLISCATEDPPSQSTMVTHFMRGLRTGHVRDEVYRHSPSTFDEAVRLALDAEFNFRQQKFDSNKNGPVRSFKAYKFHSNRNDGPSPMEICSVQTSNHNRPPNRFPRFNNNRRNGSGRPPNRPPRDKSNDTCHRCQKKGHWSPDCPTAPRRNVSSNGRPPRPSAGANTKNDLIQ